MFWGERTKEKESIKWDKNFLVCFSDEIVEINYEWESGKTDIKWKKVQIAAGKIRRREESKGGKGQWSTSLNRWVEEKIRSSWNVKWFY